MKKPLILLVDDERAILSALEAELRPAFEEIARIEAFDDPRAVLAALPGWAAEQRAIAVAIVDQKMPEMAGVELLIRLRGVASQAYEAAPRSAREAGAAAPGAAPEAGREAAHVVERPAGAAGAFHPARRRASTRIATTPSPASSASWHTRRKAGG